MNEQSARAPLGRGRHQIGREIGNMPGSGPVPAAGAAGPAATRHWRRFAACRSADPELFFPVSASGPSVTQTAKANAFCAGCQVRRDCLAFALATRQPHGIWGGTSAEERLAGGSAWTHG